KYIILVYIFDFQYNKDTKCISLFKIILIQISEYQLINNRTEVENNTEPSNSLFSIDSFKVLF
ncbi:MAG: hypothetical protein WBF83_10450, partial [Moheibacter sp.]